MAARSAGAGAGILRPERRHRGQRRHLLSRHDRLAAAATTDREGGRCLVARSAHLRGARPDHGHGRDRPGHPVCHGARAPALRTADCRPVRQLSRPPAGDDPGMGTRAAQPGAEPDGQRRTAGRRARARQASRLGLLAVRALAGGAAKDRQSFPTGPIEPRPLATGGTTARGRPTVALAAAGAVSPVARERGRRAGAARASLGRPAGPLGAVAAPAFAHDAAAAEQGSGVSRRRGRAAADLAGGCQGAPAPAGIAGGQHRRATRGGCGGFQHAARSDAADHPHRRHGRAPGARSHRPVGRDPPLPQPVASGRGAARCAPPGLRGDRGSSAPRRGDCQPLHRQGGGPSRGGVSAVRLRARRRR